MPKKFLMIIGVLLLIGAGVWGSILLLDRHSSVEPVKTTNSTAKSSVQAFDKTKYPTDKAGSIWWVINKQHPLPDGYVPPDLIVPAVRLRLGPSEEQMQFSQTAEVNLKKMFAAASAENITLVFGSGYRSEALQRQFYNDYVARDGRAAADLYSARPGTSEHQTGLAFDATSSSQKCHLQICYEDLPEGKWISANAYKYGFIIRYAKGKTDITGYQYEPWHLRYVGKELATEMHDTGIKTLEEFFNISGGKVYAE